MSALQRQGRTRSPDMIVTTTTHLSQRTESSPLWFGVSPKRLRGRGLTRTSPSSEIQRSEAAPRVFPLRPAQRRAAREGVLVEGATPLLPPSGAARAGFLADTPADTLNLSFLGVAPSTVIPAGRLKCPRPGVTSFSSTWP